MFFLLGVLAVYAVSVQLRTSLARGVSLANYLSLFTTQSNIFVAVVLIFAPHRASLRGAATLYMTMTGVIYALFLAHADPALWEWDNLVLHYVMPLAMLALWFAYPPKPAGSYLQIVVAWLVYPAVYACYTLVRGALIHWYPYGFIDPRAIGPAGVASTIAGVGAFASMVALGLAWYAKRGRSTLLHT